MKAVAENQKKEGFDGQRAINIPKSILSRFCNNNKLINNAFITDIGYYPKAKFHFRKRENGSEQNILIYCQEGAGRVSMGDETYILKGGDFIFIPSRISHSYETAPENPWTIYWCHFKGSQAEEFIKTATKHYGSLKGSIDFAEQRISLFDSLYRALETGYSYENLTYVNIMFPQFLSSFIFDDRFRIDLKSSVEDIIERSYNYMQQNLDQPLTLAMIANHIGSSASHFSSIFKNRTGFPPIEYLNHLKIQKACQYLQFTQLRIKEIGLKVGIEDQYYFSRLFTKIMSASPSDYRNRRNSEKQK